MSMREAKLEYIDNWAEQMKEDAARLVAQVARPLSIDRNQLLQIVASAWAADCADARNFMQEHCLTDAHMSCVIGNRMDIIDAYTREENDRYVSTFI